MQKHANIVDLVKSFPTSIYLQTLASIQPRTSLVKFARSPRTDPPGQHQRRERLRGGHGPHQTRPRRGRRAGPALQDGPDGRWALSMRFRLVDIGLGRRIHLTFHLVFVSFQERSVSAQKPFERSFRFSQAKFFCLVPLFGILPTLVVF